TTHNRAPGSTATPFAVDGPRIAKPATRASAVVPVAAATTRASGARRTTDHAATNDTASTTTAAGPSGAIGMAAAQRATPASHHRIRCVGACSTGASGTSNPAIGPTVRPHIMSGPARGTANTFAGSDTSGTEPNVGTNTTAAPTCAAIDAANSIGTRRRVSTGVTNTRPAHAATDS